MDVRSFTDEDMAAADAMRSNDILDRYTDHAAIARRNRRLVGMLAECGTCDRLLDTGNRRDVQHAAKCADDNRPYQYGTARN